MNVNASIGLSILAAGNSGRGGFDYSSLFAGAKGGVAYDAGGVTVALEQAEQNEAKQLAEAAKDPQVQKDLARYVKVLKQSSTIEELLDDPVARRVLLKANGLGAYSDSIALAKKALASDPTDSKSLANRLAGVEGGWLEMTKSYNFSMFDLTLLKVESGVKEIKDNYLAELRLDGLDKQLPGLGSALLFKRIAKDLDSAVKILGSKLGREVITTALGLPKQIALQSLEAQEKAILKRLDPAKLGNTDFVDKLVTRYLIQLNGGTTGVIA